MSDKPMMQLDQLKAARAPRSLVELPISDTELCTRYEALFTAAINDVLRERNILYQTLPRHLLGLRDGMRVAGIAFTVKGCKDLDLRNDMEERITMLEALHDNAVVAWDTSGDDESAQWGEVMTMAAQRQGCRGAVVDGGVRDVDRILELDFPVFCRYRSSNGMLGRFRITGWQIPIRIGEVSIHPGDVIFGDMDGALVVPRDIAYEVLLRGEEIMAHETEIKRWVTDGMPARGILDRGGYF